MDLKLKNRAKGSLKKVMVYGLDGSGKSTFAEQYCHENGLTPIVIDVDDTNFTNLDIVDEVLGRNLQAYNKTCEIIKDIRKLDEYDTIVLDGVTSLLERLTSDASGQAAYLDRAKRWSRILFLLESCKKHLILIGQTDMEVIYTEDYQSPKAIINVNGMVNEKYLTYVEKGQYKHEVLKCRTYKGKPLETTQVEPETSDEDLRGHVKEIVKSLCEMAKNRGKPCLKGVLLKCLKECTKLTSEEKEVTKQFIRDLPNGEVNL